MISVFQSLITHSDEKWVDHIERIGVEDIFGPLLKAYPDEGVLSGVIKYILYTYSEESEMLALGKDWMKTKQRIFEKCCIKPEKKMYEDLIHLQNDIVIAVIHKWMEYQDNDTFSQIQILKDLRVEMQVSCTSPIKKSSGEIDYSQKFLNAGYTVELKKMIKDLESELIQNTPLLKDAVKEIRSAGKGAKSFGAETFFKS